MRSSTFYIFLCIYLAFGSTAFAEEADSVSVKELQELVITADRGWLEKDRIVFIPNKTERKLSNSPQTLIESMHLPMLRVVDNTITTLAGEPVGIFINGSPATNVDMAAFWAKDAKRVEYIENPKDPKFQGATRVVNFIMQEYAAGGVTKLEYSQRVPNSNFGNISSKLSYKKLTIGVMADGGYYYDHRQSEEGITEYLDLYYNREHFNKISRESKSSKILRENQAAVNINALLRLNNFEMLHSVNWSWHQEPGDIAEDTGDWVPQLFSSNHDISSLKSRKNNISVSGRYTYQFNPKWYIGGKWSYTHSYVTRSTLYQSGDLPEISNNAIDTGDAFNVNITPTYYLSNMFQFQLNLESKTTWYNTLYSGSANTAIRQSRNESVGTFTWFWRPIDPLQISLRPGISVFTTLLNQKSNTSVQPSISGDINWNVNKKVFLGAQCGYYSAFPPAAMYSPVLVKTSELLWSEGNPELKPYQHWWGMVNFTYLPRNWFSMGGYIHYHHTINDLLPSYRIAPQETGGLIMSTINDNPSDACNIALNFNFSTFNDKFHFTSEPRYNHTLTRPLERKRLNNFGLYLKVDYVIRNCRFAISYTTAEKSLSMGGRRLLHSPDDLRVSFTYGTGNLYLSIQGSYILNNKIKFTNVTDFGCYKESLTMWRTGRQLLAAISYTFGYGKKIDYNIRIQQGEQISSSIIGSN